MSPRYPSPPAGSTSADWRWSVAALASDWLLIALGFALAARWPHPLVYVGSALLIARTQLALAVMMHESAHRLLFRSRRVNDVVGQWFAAAPLWASLNAYRYGHLEHHRAPMVDDDPVAVIFQINDYPISRWRLAGRLALDLLGLSYFISLGKIFAGSHRALLAGAAEPASNRWIAPASIVLMQGALWGALALAGHGWLYLGLWIVPALTLLSVMGRIRAIMEHAGHGPGEDQARNARTIVKPSLQTFFFGPHAIHYHVEHHLYPGVPFHRLGELHRWVEENGLLPDANRFRGYGQVLREVTARVDASA